jgi:two-component sensor histidine kinase
MDELVAARSQREKDEQHRELLVGELDHRVKNLLATVQAVARQSFKAANIDPAVLDTFNARLRNMAESHSVIMRDHWQTASLADIVRAAVAPFDSPANSPFSISGAAVTLDPKSALALGMALHELCTNAAKYGALSTEEGRVSVNWHIEAEGESRSAVLSWRESGGPGVAPPSQKGFGTTMIEKMLAGQIGGMVAVDYAPDGLQCVITMPLINT